MIAAAVKVLETDPTLEMVVFVKGILGDFRTRPKPRLQRIPLESETEIERPGIFFVFISLRMKEKRASCPTLEFPAAGDRATGAGAPAQPERRARRPETIRPMERATAFLWFI
jgi:hypothetical protein